MREVAVGLDLGGTTLVVGVADLDGRLLHTETLPTRAERGAEQAIDRVLDAGRALVERAGARAAGIGVATMGVTHDDRVELAPNVPGWERLRLPDRVAGRFPDVPLLIDNDVKAAALAEVSWGALRGLEVGLYLNLGTGVAAALTLHGEVVRGSHGAAGEIGYHLRSPAEPIDAGAAAGQAPLEEYVGGQAISRAFGREFGEPVSTEEIFRRVGTGDRQALDFLRPRLDAIAFHLTNLAITTDPGRIAVGGGLARSESLLFPVLRQRLRAFVPYPPEVVPAHFTSRAGLVGATALALRARDRR